ncbi:uncharacterized protein M421DRAFT_417893 [Didymella exigua CBS 183.55]|uniref:F-box domain-containing protein n=1 Tax=Didymella exigua CBS 183.55 TaxID=1150837 RepID=A0A6A5RV55_9PLEO|nr:uncharacterized protein M421DRAFT_417893 [Didymella exigua CBS 183.55]KAF1931240.1 hypothetical protein M421DRAFT_417893 [Didymella exigua CBS 183.55]
MRLTEAGSLFLAMPGELRNRIYSHIVEDSLFRVLRKPVWRQPRPADHIWNPNLWNPAYGLTQVCRNIRSEFLPIYRAANLDNVLPHELYEYIDAFLQVSGTSDDQIAGSVIIDFSANASILDIKPLLRLLREFKDLHVGAYDILEDDGFEPGEFIPPPDIRDILSDLYNIIDMEAFYNYVEISMTMLEVECDDTKGVEIVFELGADDWEGWMGVWSRPQDDPQSRVGIPLEIAENVVQWGRRCGMELNRAEGSHLTVNFRQRPRTSPLVYATSG